MTTVAPKDLFLPLATYNVRKYEGSCNCSLVISLYPFYYISRHKKIKTTCNLEQESNRYH
jgi:hypothetical protein